MMKTKRLLLLTLLISVGALAGAEDGFTPLFNGKTLEGWDGNPELWSVEDGAITGRTKGPEHLSYNQFLIWRGGEVKNFELKANIRVTGNNSGVQYRSKEMPDIGKWAISGYQCDVHPTAVNNAMIYHEKGRGIIVKNGQSVVTDPQGEKWIVAERDPVAVDVAKWHEYRIVAKGNHIQHFVDGKLTVELADHDEGDPGRSLAGLLALQIHRGPAMEVQIKDILLKTLPDGGVTPFAKADIPPDAQKIEKPAPRAPKAKKGAPKGKGKAKAAPKPKRPTTMAPASGENSATPVDRIKVPEGFEVELLYSVPGPDHGSWVALCNDDKGRIYASDQYGDLYRFTPPAAAGTLKKADVEKVPVNIRAINGMVFAFGALYAGVNDYEKKIPSGLYRISDSDDDDQLDKVELLRAINSGGDHGVHAVVPTPDGEGLFLVTGNNADLTEVAASSPVQPTWGEDHLLPRMPDGRGHNRNRLGPGGIIYRVSPDGKEFKAIASGFRNIYGADVNKHGELFTYDADMEYDFNTPWYRPTRINHVVSGAEYGWRNGAGKFPEFYTDNLPAVLNIGPGSPTGARFGYGAKFPVKYQEAFYVLDWSWGKIYAVHLEEEGASYTATKEEFITGAPLPVTDLIIHPDGAMYFAIGGRKVQSGFYRVTYKGSEDTTPPPNVTRPPSEAVRLRHELEAFHGKQDAKAIASAWPNLDHDDRFVAWAARVALEHQPTEGWADKALGEISPARRIPALLALTRLTGVDPDHRSEGHVVDTAMRDRILDSLLELDFSALTSTAKIGYVRTVEIVLNRFGDPDKARIDALIAKLDPAFPADTFELNWLLCETLAYLQAPNTASKGMALILAAESQEPQMEYARSLRFLKTGWTPELRQQQLEWFLKAANYRGGASFAKFIEFIRNDSLATFTEAEKKQHAELIAKKPEVKSAIENLGAMFVGRTPTVWTLDELSAAAKDGMTGRNFAQGRKAFSAAACFACHRFGNAGGMTGPDLTGAGGRYSPHDLLDQIINPSKEINEQFAPIVVTMKNGDLVTGVVVNLNGDNVTVNTDLTDPNQRTNVDRKLVESIEVSKVSPMPPMLLAMLTKEEILDLIAYALSGGDPENEMFKK
ncbi:MAG: putative heme-binding domain-containing protein [Verrucomicrobiales bacterium]|jgi:putative heme-binding domain-containing protein